MLNAWQPANTDRSLAHLLPRRFEFVTKATSTEAARTYLGRMDFAAIITDLGRCDDRDAGLKFMPGQGMRLVDEGCGVPRDRQGVAEWT
jgi:hypothetical protein